MLSTTATTDKDPGRFARNVRAAVPGASLNFTLKGNSGVASEPDNQCGMVTEADYQPTK